MYTFLRESEPVAKKEHNCSACEHLLSEGHPREIDFTPEERESIKRAEAVKWKVQKGEKYYNQVGIYEGHFQSFKAIKEIHQICMKYNYYDYD